MPADAGDPVAAGGVRHTRVWPSAGSGGPPLDRANSVVLMAKRMTLLELCTRAAIAVEGEPSGWRDRARIGTTAGRVCSFVIEWAWLIRETGNEHPTVEDYAEWAHVSRRTAFYRQAAFRKLFGEWHDDPTPLARHVNEWAAKHDGSPRQAFVPDVLAAA